MCDECDEDVGVTSSLGHADRCEDEDKLQQADGVG